MDSKYAGNTLCHACVECKIRKWIQWWKLRTRLGDWYSSKYLYPNKQQERLSQWLENPWKTKTKDKKTKKWSTTKPKILVKTCKRVWKN